VRGQILAAARTLFLEQGYAATTTREIARRADVVEPLVYRQFGSKAGLLEQVLVEPLTEFVDGFLDRWEHDRTASSLEERTREWIGTVYDLTSANRELLIGVLAGREPDVDGAGTPGLAVPLDRMFTALAEMTRVDFEARGTYQDAELGVRFTFALVTSVVLLEHWLFAPGQPRPDHAALLSGLVDYVLSPRAPTRAASARRGTRRSG
jgi:AcrR family transcriptional regulator